MEFKRRVDKTKIPTCNIMGVNIAAINMNWLLEYTDKHIKDLSGDYICVTNVHATVMAYENPDYLAIQNNSVMSIPDGGPLATVGRWRGCKNLERTTGPGYMEEIFLVSKEKGYRHFFYGSTEETLEKMKRNLGIEFEGLEIAGMYSPPFRELTAEEDASIIDKINSADVDFVWIGLGAPKQEKWMLDHQGRIKGFMVGVGAGFDYYAGNIKRAPKWMQKSNMEWFFRLLQEPKRLFTRYLTTNTKFIWHAVIRRR